jgi:hypothetical protein
MKIVTVDAAHLTTAQLGRALREFAAAIEGGDVTPAQEGSWRGLEAGVTWSNTAPEPLAEDAA